MSGPRLIQSKYIYGRVYPKLDKAFAICRTYSRHSSHSITRGLGPNSEQLSRGQDQVCPCAGPETAPPLESPSP